TGASPYSSPVIAGLTKNDASHHDTLCEVPLSTKPRRAWALGGSPARGQFSRPELALGHHLLEGVARHIQGQVDPAPPAGRLPGCKDQLRRPQSVTAAKRRILPFLEGPYKVGDRPVDITRAEIGRASCRE